MIASVCIGAARLCPSEADFVLDPAFQDGDAARKWPSEADFVLNPVFHDAGAARK